MRLVRSLGVAMALLWILPGCGEREAASSAADVAHADVAPKPARRDGVVIVADRQEPVGPFVMHDPHLDLFVRCQMKRDVGAKKGLTVPLCFDPTRRGTERLKVLRVERTGGDMGGALRRLSAGDESAHFVVEKTGTPHQVLDLAYAVRRDGALRPDELRVVTCHDSAWKKLADALTTLIPGLRVEVTDLAPVPAAGAPAAPAPPPPPTPPTSPGGPSK